MTVSGFTLPTTFVERFAADLYRCSSCNYCVDAVWPERGISHVCATLEHHSPAPGYSGRGFIDAARALIEQQPLDPASVAARVFTCTGCGNCETLCPLELQPAAVGQALREVFHDAGLTPATVAAAQARQRAGRTPRIRPPDEQRSDGGAVDIVAGCATDAALEVAAFLASGGQAARLYGHENNCCGARLAELGAAQEAGAWAGSFTAPRSSAAAPLVVLDYTCLEHLRARGEAAVMSLPAWLESGLAARRFALNLRADAGRAPQVILLEACRLKPRPGMARGDDERWVRQQLTALGVRIGNDAFPSPHVLCCGAAGGMPDVAPDAARRMACARDDDHDGSDAAVRVTLDARCAAHFVASGKPVISFGAFLARYCTLSAGPAV